MDDCSKGHRWVMNNLEYPFCDKCGSRQDLKTKEDTEAENRRVMFRDALKIARREVDWFLERKRCPECGKKFKELSEHQLQCKDCFPDLVMSRG